MVYNINCFNCPIQGECCKCSVSFDKKFIEKHKDKVQREIIEFKEGVPITKEDKCIFLQGKLCAIHDNKPEICKKFGTKIRRGIVCREQKPDGTKWTKEELNNGDLF